MVVTTARGSAPRGPGACLLVTRTTIDDTIGGGTLEFRAIELARELLSRNVPAAHVRVPLGPSLGQCCGGLVTLAFKRLTQDDCGWLAALQARRAQAAPIELDLDLSAPVRIEEVEGEAPSAAAIAVQPATAAASGLRVQVRGAVLPILLFGAGHVGRALIQALAPLPVAVHWIDTRDDALPATLPPNVRAEVTDTPLAEVAAAPASAAFVVMTHLHSLDEDIARAVLERGDFAYLGVIGSTPKRQRFEKRFAARGLPPDLITRMQMPIGIAGVAGKEPEVIAASVAAELMQVRARLVPSQRQKKPDDSPRGSPVPVRS